MKKPLLALAILALGSPAWAATETVTLSVPGMNCAACPITVKLALSRVEGVSEVDVHYDRREVTVVYDDTKTDQGQLTAATANSGYPSSVKHGDQTP